MRLNTDDRHEDREGSPAYAKQVAAHRYSLPKAS